MDKAHRPIEELEVFKRFEAATRTVWTLARNWQQFDRDTIVKQFVRAADSINANLVEGDARYSGPDSLRFFVIARASARETRLWAIRAKERSLIPDEQAFELIETLDSATQLLNRLINYRRNEGPTMVRDLSPAYLSSGDEWAELDSEVPRPEHLNT